MKKVVVLTGAGISAESGVATFRGSGGLWEGYDIAEVATPQAWDKNYKLVLEFYNARRRNIAAVKPNEAHRALADMQQHYVVQIITQNIDNLHEQAGSTHVLHVHGEITKACSSNGKRHVQEIGFRDILDGETCTDGFQLRPFIVWFGEDVPLIPRAAELVSQADVLLIIGTSLEVYPANGLVNFAQSDIPIYVIDPDVLLHKISVPNKVVQIQKSASEGIIEFMTALKSLN
jgi:NAD-dependent deacetylase